MKFRAPKFRTQKERIFLAFFLYSAVSFLVSIISFWLFREMEEIDRIVNRVNAIHDETLYAIGYGREFFMYEALEDEFYENGTSTTINQHDQQLKHILSISDTLKRSKLKSFKIRNDILLLDSLLLAYRLTFRDLVERTKFRGFKEYGLEGIMRQYIHELENNKLLNQELVLHIRKNEKDYMLRLDTAYMHQVFNYCHLLKDDIDKSRSFTPEMRSRLKTLLTRYEGTFLKIVDLDIKFGYKRLSGLNLLLKQQSDQINESVKQINHKALERRMAIFDRIQIALVLIVTISVILSLLLSVSFRFVLNPLDSTNASLD